MRIKIIFFTFLLTCVNLAGARPPKIAPIKSLDYDPPKAHRLELNNGSVLYYLEDHELPLFSLTVMFHVSPADVPKNKNGAMSLMGSVWRSGGTKTLSPEELNKLLEGLAAGISSSAGEESASLSLSCLSKDTQKLIPVFFDVLLAPKFDAKQIKLEKLSILEGLRRRNDSLFGIGRRAFRDIIYGETHFYASDWTQDKVKNIRQKDLINLHKKILAPNQAMFIASGHFDKEELLSLLDQGMKNWKTPHREVPEFEYYPLKTGNEDVFFVEKDSTQSLVYMGGIGVSRHDKNTIRLEVADNVLGGGGPSRLFGEVRSRLGLAYVVASFFTSPRGPGLVGGVVQTQAQSTVKSIRAMKKVMEDLSRSVPSEEEMRVAKGSIVNSFVFRFESPKDTVAEIASLEFYGYPDDYLDTYIPHVKAVTGEDVRKMIDQYWYTDKLKILVVGEKEKLDEPLTVFGSVKEIPLEGLE